MDFLNVHDVAFSVNTVLESYKEKFIKDFIEDNNIEYHSNDTYILSSDFSFKNEKIIEKISQIGKYFLDEECTIIFDNRNNSLIEISFCEKEINSYIIVNYFSKNYIFAKNSSNNFLSLFKEYLVKNDNIMRIYWYNYSSQGYVNDISIEENLNDIFYNAAYPMIEDLDEYILKYFKSNESVIMLMGAPGTGKSRLIRYFLKKAKEINFSESVYYTNDKMVLESDDIFESFLSSKTKLLVLEDMDFELQSRKEGNKLMYKILGLSDGIIQNLKKKIIFSTNLPSIKDIDEALVRPGRCFDIIKTRLLNKDESRKLLDEMEVKNYDLKKNNYSLAEIYSIKNGSDKKSFRNETVGF